MSSPHDELSAGRRIEAWLLIGLGRVLRAFPVRARVRCGRALGGLAGRLVGSRRKLGVHNVREALGVDAARAHAIVMASFRHFGRVMVECLMLDRYLEKDCEGLFGVEGLEHLRAAHEKGRGVIVFSAHYGNWELVAQRQALAGFPMDFVARPLDNPLLDRVLVTGRESVGNRVLGKHGALRHAVRTLRAGRSLAILIDQNATTPPRVFVPFFSRMAATTPVLARLSLRLGAPCVPVVSYPTPDGGYRIVYGAALECSEEGTEEERVERLTALATAHLEKWIADAPDYWMWFHNRWKTRPDPTETA